MLQLCPECDEEISSEAYECPHCGMPMRERPHQPSFIEEALQPMEDAFEKSLPVVGNILGCFFWVAVIVLAVSLLAAMC
jgi:uncharacterized membrane protein YvbJ